MSYGYGGGSTRNVDLGKYVNSAPNQYVVPLHNMIYFAAASRHNYSIEAK